MAVKGPVILPSRLAKPFNVDAEIHFKPPASFKELGSRARQMADPTAIQSLLRAAMAETLLAAYRKRFLEGLPGAVNMKRERRSANVKTKALGRELRHNLVKAYSGVREARLSGDPQALDQAMAALDTAKKAIKHELERKRRGNGSRLPHGMFRELALKVLDLTTDTGEIQFTKNGGTLVAGIGDLSYLEGIKTPSATPELSGHATPSTRDVMWRQLEFGTGAYAVIQGDRAPDHQLASGGWWYGRSPEESLHLRGSRPIGALKNPATLLPHDPESLQFYRVFGRLLSAVLFQ